jgi:hypothetical protein
MDHYFPGRAISIPERSLEGLEIVPGSAYGNTIARNLHEYLMKTGKRNWLHTRGIHDNFLYNSGSEEFVTRRD